MRVSLDDLNKKGVNNEIAVAYQAWLMEDQIGHVRDNVALSGLSWPHWVNRAIDRLMELDSCEDDQDEIEALLDSWPRGRVGKKYLSFRLFPSTLDRCRDLATKHNVTIQAVFGHAFSMQCMAESLARSMDHPEHRI